MGDPSIACSGPSDGPYSVEVSWAFSDGVAERASGTFASHGNYTLAGNRQDSFYIYLGPPPVESNETVQCVILSSTSPA